MRASPRIVLFVAVLALAGAAGSPGARVETITVAATGDLVLAPSRDGGRSFLSQTRRELRGDLVLGNLEGTLAAGGVSKCALASTDCYAFRAPPSYAGVLRRGGFTILNLANNHAYDYGAAGAAETVAALDDAGLRHTGRPSEIAYLRAGKMRVAVLGFAPYPWAQSLLDLASARRLVRRAAARADVVVVTMHAGAEGPEHAHVSRGDERFLGERRGNPIAFAHAVVDAGADLVVGHGPHVLRAAEWYHGRLIAYSLGNFLGPNGTLNLEKSRAVSAVLQVSLRANGSWAGGKLVAVKLVSPGVPARDPSGAARGMVRTLSREDFGRNAMRITPTGLLLPPAWRVG